MGSEEGDGMTCADTVSSWQQYYTWCTSYSHSHPNMHHHHQHHQHHHHQQSHNSHQYQSNQYQQLPEILPTVNASTHYSSTQQNNLQLQTVQSPPPPPSLDHQRQFRPIRGQASPRRTVHYDAPGIQSVCLLF